MHRFFTERIEEDGAHVRVVGSDFNHMKNVLRLHEGEEVIVSDGIRTYRCIIRKYLADEALLLIEETVSEDKELPVKITLYQGLPKSDKMETVIQKAVELGVYKVVPVEMKRSVVRLDEKKAKAKQARWQMIAESAAKQSGRQIVPEVADVCSYEEALSTARQADLFLLPYECETAYDKTAEALQKAAGCKSIAVMIGPEGGFEETEATDAKACGAVSITLGKRILRTETAGPALLSMLVYILEIRNA